MMSMTDWSKEIHAWAHSKKFYPLECELPCAAKHMTGSRPALIMLVVTELAEAVEADRKGDEENFAEEIADAVIRLLDLCGAEGIDIEAEVRKKMAINHGRPMRHGKAY